MAERIAILRRVAAEVRNQHEALALLIASEGGKPLLDARVEVTRAAAGLEFLAGEGERLAGHAIPMGATAATAGRIAFTIREPLGPVLAISAFNHPLNLIVHQVGPALIAGCPVLVKPALETPLSAQKLLQLLHQAGLPSEWAELLIVDNDVSEALVADPRVRFVNFIGSAAVGWKLRRVAANGTGLALEHGGTAPVIVDATADLERAAALVTKGGYYHAGQVCVSVQRVLVQREVAANFREALLAEVKRLTVGDPRSAETAVGPLIRAREVERITSWLAEAKAGGAQLLTGGTPIGQQAFAPTVVEGAPSDCRLMREEVFGPVVTLQEVPSLAAAVELANASRWHFQAAIFTARIDAALQAARSLRAATVLINDHTAFRADWMPFGGWGESGLGVGGLPYSLAELSREKLIVFNG